jgi:hypothetical protein
LVADGAWCWFQDPRAIHYVGAHDRTYVGYVTSTGDIDVVSLDNGTAALTHTTLHPKFQADDHAAPGLEVLPDGRIAVFYSKHGGAQMYYRISVHPEDISTFGPEKTVDGRNSPGGKGFTYANPIYLPAEHRTYLFFRSGDNRPAVMWSSDANLAHWSDAQDIAVPDGAGSFARPYAKYATNGTDSILIAFTDGHPRDVKTNSIYALIYRGGVLHSVDGRSLATLGPRRPGNPLPAAPVHTKSLAKAYDGAGTGGKAWVHSVAFGQDGHPVIAFASFPRSAPADTDHRYHYTRWTGSAWTDNEFVAAGGSIVSTGSEPDYSGGLTLDPNDPSTLYTSREAGKAWRIQRWHTPDGGVHFDAPVDLTPDSPVKNVRPIVPWGPPGDVQALWMSGRYDHWKGNFLTQIRALTTGPAPTTTRISLSTPGVTPGQPLTVSGRVVQGYQGTVVAHGRLSLWSHLANQPYREVSTVTADATGLVQWTVRQSADTRYQVRFTRAAPWGASVSPSPAVGMMAKTAIRLSVDHATVVAGRPVVVGIRLVAATSGAGIVNVPVQLWQSVNGRTWAPRATVRTGSGGLTHVTTHPGVSVSYQARFAGSATLVRSSCPPHRVGVVAA